MTRIHGRPAAISIYLDTRKIKKNGKYPVKVRLFTSSPKRVQKLYPTKFDFTKEEFESIWNSQSPRGKNRETQDELKATEAHFKKTYLETEPFTFEAFERKLYRKPGDETNLVSLYNERISELRRFGQIKTAQISEGAMKSFGDFTSRGKKRKLDSVSLFDISPNWLNEYEVYMTETKGRSSSTVGIYLRTLRTVFKKAIDDGDIESEFYPFKKRKYVIPASRNKKRPLNEKELRILFQAEPKNAFQEKAKDFWLFSYACFGINVKDIALLKHQNIHGDQIEFIRAKTKRTSKGNQTPITFALNEFSRSIIEKYGSDANNPEDLVFSILDGKETPEQEVKKIQNFTRFINQHIKKLAADNKLPDGISTYWARHTFATNAVRNGAPLELIQESLGHQSLKTTQNYFAGFTGQAKKILADSLMDFNS